MEYQVPAKGSPHHKRDYRSIWAVFESDKWLEESASWTSIRDIHLEQEALHNIGE